MLHTNNGCSCNWIGSRSGRATLLSAVLVAAASVLALGCHQDPTAISAPVTVPAAAVTTVQPTPTQPTDKDQTPAAYTAFDGDAAFAYLKKQCDFGVRPNGSVAHEKCLAYLLEEMRKYADQTITQKFNYKTSNGNLSVSNVIGIFNPNKSEKPSTHPVLLLAHWDTRPIADGPFSSQTRQGVVFRYNGGLWRPSNAPIMGADDAASGVAVLLELAKMFHEHKPKTGVIILLDDGEDYGDFKANNDEGDGVEMGARYFAEHYKENPVFGQPSYGILLDMVGAKNAFFPREGISDQYAKSINDRVYGAAEALGYGAMFPKDKTQQVGDDHLSINQHNIPTIDLIHPLPYYPYEQTGYTFWHTTEDTVDKCGPKPLKAVGDVLARVIYSEAP